MFDAKKTAEKLVCISYEPLIGLSHFSNNTGDSGGPLFDANGVQIGVVSYGT